MPVITGNESVAANTTSTNRLTGNLNEFLGRPSIVALFVTAAATGINAQLLIGAESIIDDEEVSDANLFPRTPEDFLARGAGFQGDRLILRWRNTTGGALVVKWRLEIDPLQ